MRSRLTVVALLASAMLGSPPLAPTAGAQADTIRRPLFTTNDIVLAGIFTVGAVVLHPIDKSLAERVRDPRNQDNRFYRNMSTAVRTIADPGSYLIGTSMYLIGRVSKNERLADLGLHGTEALFVGAATATVLKGAFGRARPYVTPRDSALGRFDPNNFGFGRGYRHEQYRSFPSGHSTAAFAAAAAVANETSRWWPSTRWIIGPLMYGGATAVGVSRMYDNKHWASDVVMGAAIGTFAGNKVVRFHHRTHPGNRFDRLLLGASLRPAPDGSMALSLSIVPGR